MSRAKNEAGQEGSPFLVRMATRFVMLSLLSCVLVAFAVGRTARIILFINPQKEMLARQLADANSSVGRGGRQMVLPSPILQEGKTAPQTTYTSKNFDTAKSASINSRWVVTDNGQTCSADSTEDHCQNKETLEVPVQEGGDTEELHLPQGQHLLVDIRNVNGPFLNDEEALANAMLDLVNESELTLLSYHCHGMVPMGVSCAGVLLESHVSFHTWPVEGVITLDLFTCGDKSLLPTVEIVEKLFGIPATPRVPGEHVDPPAMVWAHKYRGFSTADSARASELTDFFNFPIGVMSEYKKSVVSAETDFQRVDIYDALIPGFQSLEDYQKSLEDNGSYHSQNAELFQPDRIVFLDGVMQSRRTGDAAYHEALVHPAMFAHDAPKRVAIIGGGEGATLREVLKHDTVEKVVMIEIDEKMVNLSREHIPYWSDCSMLKNSTNSCFDDPRVEVYFEDAFQWFIDRYGSLKKTDAQEEAFDIVIMDALDPQVQKDFVDALYDGGPFLGSLPAAISKHGVFVGQVGEAPGLTSPSEEHSNDRNRLKFIRTLGDLGFASIRDYEEPHGGFDSPWQFVVAFKDFESRQMWFAPPTMTDTKIRHRMRQTKSGESPLLYFDGATMMSYLHPTKGSEAVFCRRENKHPSCNLGHGFDMERISLPLSTLEVGPSSLGEHVGRGVFAKADIPHKSYVGLEKLVPLVYLTPDAYDITWQTHKQWADKGHSWWPSRLAAYSIGYGHHFSRHGGVEVTVDSTFHCFINHGCKGSNNVGHVLSVAEETADPGQRPEEILYQHDYTYNPLMERQVHFHSSAVPRQDIARGEELLDNYLGMVGRYKEDWEIDVKALKAQCNGGHGLVKEYEVANRSSTQM